MMPNLLWRRVVVLFQFSPSPSLSLSSDGVDWTLLCACGCDFPHLQFLWLTWFLSLVFLGVAVCAVAVCSLACS